MNGATQRQAGRSLATVGALAIVAVALAACSTTRAAEPDLAARPLPALSVQVAEVRTGQMAKTLSYTGDVKPKAQVAIVPKIAGRVDDVRVDVGSEVRPGALIVVLEHAALEAQVRQAEAALAGTHARLAAVEAGPRTEVVEQAKASVDAAKQRLSALNKGPRVELVAQAEANARAAEARLQQLKNGPTAEQRRSALMSVEGAKVRLHAANVQKDGDCNPVKPEYFCKASEANAFAAAYAVDAAQAQYDALVAPPTAEQVAQAQAALDAAREQLSLARQPYTEQDVAQAEDALRVAEQQLLLAQRPFTANDLQAARAAVDQAAAALDLAALQLKESYITAPVAGIVTERFVNVGSMASPQAPIVSIAGREVEVHVAVEDAKAGLVAPGQAVSLTVGALPGQSVFAVVGSVAPTVDPRTRTVLVKVAPVIDEPELRPGMFVQAAISLGARDGTLIVPKEAIVKRDGQSVAYVMRDGEVHQRPVRTGWNDDRNVEVLDGLAGGEQVVVTRLGELTEGTAVAVEGR